MKWPMHNTYTCLFNEEKRLTFQLADQLAASRDKTVSSLLKKHLVFVFNRRKPEITPSITLFLNTSRNFRHVGWYLQSECELHLVSGRLMDVKRKSLFLRIMPKNIIRGLEGQKSNKKAIFKAKLEIIGFGAANFAGNTSHSSYLVVKALFGPLLRAGCEPNFLLFPVF